MKSTRVIHLPKCAGADSCTCDEPKTPSRKTRKAQETLEAHMKLHAGQLLTADTFASKEFDVLYLEWIRCRWDDGHAWTRNVWKERP
jgi:hypothetical protein